MKKLRWTAAIPYLAAMLFSAELTPSGTFSSPALAAAPQPSSAEPDIVASVKNAAARKLVSDAIAAFRSGNSRLAITLLKRAVNASPQDGWVRLLLGRVSFRSGDPASAELQLRQARSYGVPDEMVLSTLFGAMIQRHEELKLLNEFPEPAANTKRPSEFEILRGRARAMRSLGRIDDAAAELDRALSMSRDADTLLERAGIANRQNNRALADSLADEAFKREPNNGRAMLAKLNSYSSQNNNSAALALSEKILKAFPNDLSARVARIETFLRLHQDSNAKAELSALAARMPNAPITLYYRASFLARANDPMGAWKIAQTLPPDFSQNYPAYIDSVSRMAINSGNVETGVALLAAGVARSPDRMDLRLRLAQVRLSQGSPQAAALIMAPVKDSTDPQALAMVGTIALQNGDNKEALEKLTSAHDAQPKNGEITFHLIQALDANGKRNNAKDMLKSLLAGGTGFDDLQNARQLQKSWH